MVKHLRKRRTAPYFEMFMVVFATIEPLSTVPQIYDVYHLRDAHAVSLLTWLLTMATSLIWLIYGIRIRSWPLIASDAMWLVSELILIIGIVLYS